MNSRFIGWVTSYLELDIEGSYLPHIACCPTKPDMSFEHLRLRMSDDFDLHEDGNGFIEIRKKIEIV